jgi:hypothetical protein
LPLIELDQGNFAAVSDCQGLDDCQRAIYLKEMRLRIYRRVRCAEELFRIGPDEIIPAPKTVNIEPAVPRTLGRDRLMPQLHSYSICV